MTSDRLLKPCEHCVDGRRLRWQALRTIRQATGRTQRAMAGYVGVSPAFLNDVESGRRRLPPRVERAYRKLAGLPL